MRNFEPYYAVIFTSIRTKEDKGYDQMAEQMENLARQQKGFLGFESARSEIGISVSYWKTIEAISKWKAHADHQWAQKRGREDWYQWYRIRVCKVEREYDFAKD